MARKKLIKTVNIEVNQETSNYIQSISMEVSSRQTLLNTISQLQGIKSSAFKDYQKEFFEFDAEFQLIKERLQEIYIPAKLRSAGVDWNLDFQTNVITVRATNEAAAELMTNGNLDYTPQVDDIIESFSEEDEDEYSTGSCCGAGGCK